MIISLIRAIILYLVIICAIKFMGKRQLGDLEASDLVVTFMISDIASIPMQNSSQSLLSGLIPVGVLVCFEVFISHFMLRNSKFRNITCGQSIIVIDNGKINQKELNKMRINIYDLCEQLRQMNVFSLSDVSYAIMESNGKLSVLKKAEKQPPDSSQLKLDVPKVSLDLVVVSNGEINDFSLSSCKLNREWLNHTISQNNVKLEDIFVMTANSDKQFQIIRKNEEQ